MSRRRTPKRQLAVHRAWAMLFIAASVYIVTVEPVSARGPHPLEHASFVFPSLAALGLWWLALVRMWASWERLRAMGRVTR